MPPMVYLQLLTRDVLFWVITQRTVIIPCWHFRTTYQSHFKGQEIQEESWSHFGTHLHREDLVGDWFSVSAWCQAKAMKQCEGGWREGESSNSVLLWIKQPRKVQPLPTARWGDKAKTYTWNKMKERQGKKRYLTKIGEILKKQKQRKEKKSQQRIIKEGRWAAQAQGKRSK